MLAQQHPNRTIFYRVCPEDKEDVLQISRGLLNRDFVHYMDQSKFVFLLRKTSLDSFWKKRRVLGFMLAEKLDHNIAEIIRWSFSDPYYIDLMMLIVMIEELYAEGIETIKWSKKNLCGANKEHVLRILNELGFLKSFSNSAYLFTCKHFVSSDLNPCPFEFFSNSDLSRELLQIFPFPLELIQLLLSYVSYSPQTCRVIRGISSLDLVTTVTPDKIFVIEKCLGWLDKSLEKTIYLVRRYVHFGAYFLQEVEGEAEFINQKVLSFIHL